LVPAPDGSNDRVGVGGPGEGLWPLVCLLDEAVDGSLEIDDGAEDAALQSSLCELGDKPFTAFSQEHAVGTKWKVKRG
jgi:hypothetical protein